MMIHGGTRTWPRQASILNVVVTLLIALLLTAPGVRAEQGGPFASLTGRRRSCPVQPASPGVRRLENSGFGYNVSADDSSCR